MLPNRYVIVLWCALVSQECLAGSLIASDSTEINGFIERGKKSRSAGNYDSATHYFKLSLRKSEETGFSRGMLSSLVNLGIICKNSGHYDEALEYYRKGVTVARKFNESSALSVFYNNLANVFTRLSQADSALHYYQKSFEIKRKEGDKKGIVNIYLNIGTLQADRRDFKSAKSYFELGLAMAGELQDTKTIAKLCNNLANIYYETGRMDSAEMFYRKVWEFKKEGGDDMHGFEGLFLNMGNIFLSKRKLDSALIYYEKSLALSEGSGDLYRMSNDLNNIAHAYLQQKKINDAISHYQKALKLAEETNSADQQKSALLGLSECYAKMKDHQMAYIYYKKGDSIATELYNHERQEQIEEMLVRFETAEKEKQLIQQKAINEKKTHERNALILASLFLLVTTGIVIFVYIRTRSLNKKLSVQKAIIEKREHEKELLLRELHHRTKNNLQIVSSLLNLQANKLSDTEAVHAVKEGQARVEAMALIHRDLYRNENVTRVNIRAYLDNMVCNLMNSYNYSAEELHLTMDVEEIELEADLAIPVGLIANELISNAFKHAFKNQDKPELAIVVRGMISGELHILVRDNGQGIAGQASKTNTFGMSMIHSLVKQLHGSVSFEDIGGCVATLAIPMKKEILIEA